MDHGDDGNDDGCDIGESHAHLKCYGISGIHGYDELVEVTVVEYLSINGSRCTYLHKISHKI